MIVIPLLKKIAELFLILFTTTALVKGRILKVSDSAVLSRLSLNFITPCVIFNSFQKELSPEITRGLLVSAGLAVAFHILFFGFAWVLKKVWKASEVERASVVFTNAGNLVIPLVSYVIGEEWVIYTSAYVVVFNILFWTVGIRMFDHESKPDYRKILLNPNLLAVAAGLISLFIGLKLPEPIALAFSDVAVMIGPLSMMITGIIVGSLSFSDLVSYRRVIGVVLFRMAVGSGLAVLLAVFSLKTGILSVDRSIVLIPLFAAIAPSASNINQVAILYNKDAKYASVINVLTTLSCIATMPLWVMVFEALAG